MNLNPKPTAFSKSALMYDHLKWGQDLKTSLSKLANDGSVGLLDHYILTILTNVRKAIT